jgi:hypothetical protein
MKAQASRSLGKPRLSTVGRKLTTGIKYREKNYREEAGNVERAWVCEESGG